jgi:hypothetical protein
MAREDLLELAREINIQKILHPPVAPVTPYKHDGLSGPKRISMMDLPGGKIVKEKTKGYPHPTPDNIKAQLKQALADGDVEAIEIIREQISYFNRKD